MLLTRSPTMHRLSHQFIGHQEQQADCQFFDIYRLLWAASFVVLISWRSAGKMIQPKH